MPLTPILPQRRRCNAFMPEPTSRMKEAPPGWSRAQPERIPPPTLSPAFLALGATLLVWGLISSYIITAIGVVLFGVALAGWIGDLRHERAQEQRTSST